jgi:hypothetical protein
LLLRRSEGSNMYYGLGGVILGIAILLLQTGRL